MFFGVSHTSHRRWLKGNMALTGSLALFSFSICERNAFPLRPISVQFPLAGRAVSLSSSACRPLFGPLSQFAGWPTFMPEHTLVPAPPDNQFCCTQSLSLCLVILSLWEPRAWMGKTGQSLLMSPGAQIHISSPPGTTLIQLVTACGPP